MKKPIALDNAIENLALLPRRIGFNLHLSVQSDTRPATKPGNPLEAITCFHRTARRFISCFAKPSGMGLVPAIDPGQLSWLEFLFIASCKLCWQGMPYFLRQALKSGLA